MAKLRRCRGDATQPTGKGNKVICHVCNDRGAWGSGFVKALSARWSAPETDYRQWFKNGEAEDFRLGSVRLIQVEPDIWVANMIAQYGTRPKGNTPAIRYEFLEECLKQVAHQAIQLEATLHMPKIGSGLAGGDWNKIKRIVEVVLTQAGVCGTFYELP